MSCTFAGYFSVPRLSRSESFNMAESEASVVFPALAALSLFGLLAMIFQITDVLSLSRGLYSAATEG